MKAMFIAWVASLLAMFVGLVLSAGHMIVLGVQLPPEETLGLPLVIGGCAAWMFFSLGVIAWGIANLFFGKKGRGE